MLKRSKRFGVGKEIGGAVYVHRLYERLLPKRVVEASQLLPKGFDYVVVKFNIKDNGFWKNVLCNVKFKCSWCNLLGCW